MCPFSVDSKAEIIFKEPHIVLHIANSPSQPLKHFMLYCTNLMGLIDGIKDCLNTRQDACQNGDNCDGVHGCRKLKQDASKALSISFLKDGRKSQNHCINTAHQISQDKRTDVWGSTVIASYLNKEWVHRILDRRNFPSVASWQWSYESLEIRGLSHCRFSSRGA